MIYLKSMPQDNGRKYQLNERTYNKLSEIFNNRYLPGYRLDILSAEEKKRLFTALYICAVRAITDGAFAENFIKDLFETVREIVHGAPEYAIDKKDGLIREVEITASGYTQQMSAVIKFYYDQNKGRNVISSIWVNQRGVLYKRNNH